MREGLGMRQARLYRYTGMVQGVGFRWTAKRIADGLGIDGYVRNNPDGSVSLGAEGDGQTLDLFMRQLDDALGHYISATDEKKAEPGNYRDGFDVVR